MAPPPSNNKLAVLIDADNAQASVVHELLAEVSRYGTATVKRAQGDWTTTNLKGWKDDLHKLVYGFGEKKTPQPFVVACDELVFTKILISRLYMDCLWDTCCA